MAERVQSAPQQSRARRCSGAAQRTLDGEDRSERITGGRKGSLIPAYSPTKIPEFPRKKTLPVAPAFLYTHGSKFALGMRMCSSPSLPPSESEYESKPLLE